MVSVADAPFHGQYALAGNPCVDGMVNVFLLNNSRPGTTTCPGVPLPNENQVYPAPGPVSSPGSANSIRSAVDGALTGLRNSTQEIISHINNWS